MRIPRKFITSVWSIVCICLTINYTYSKVRRNAKKKRKTNMYQNSKTNTWYKVKEWHKKTKEKRKPVKNMWIATRYWGRCVSKYHERAKNTRKRLLQCKQNPSSIRQNSVAINQFMMATMKLPKFSLVISSNALSKE